MKHEPPDWSYKRGYSTILNGCLYVSGEDDVDELLYGGEAAAMLNKGKGIVIPVVPSVDVWMDLRDHRPLNRIVYIPPSVQYMSFSFRDGQLTEALQVLPNALQFLTVCLEQERRVLVSCHEGRSRSMLLLLGYLCEQTGSFLDAYLTLQQARGYMEIDKRFSPLLSEWQERYKEGHL